MPIGILLFGIVVPALFRIACELVAVHFQIYSEVKELNERDGLREL
jgi:hypothetical protein